MKTLPVLVFLLISLGSFACNRAYQYRIFPLAQSENSILFLEIEMIRDARDKNLWSGSANVICFSNGSLSIMQSLDSIKLSSNNYSNDLQRLFTEAKSKIDTTIYKQLDINNIRLCRHLPQCYNLKLERISKDSIAVLHNNKNVLIKLPNTTIAEKELIAAGGIGEPFNLNSVREFVLGEQKILIVNVGTGEQESSNYKQLVKEQMQFEDNPLFPELTLYHGFCFDMVLFSE